MAALPIVNRPRAASTAFAAASITARTVAAAARTKSAAALATIACTATADATVPAAGRHPIAAASYMLIWRTPMAPGRWGRCAMEAGCTGKRTRLVNESFTSLVRFPESSVAGRPGHAHAPWQRTRHGAAPGGCPCR